MDHVVYLDAKAKELSDLRRKSPTDLWKDDLEQFLEELDVGYLKQKIKLLNFYFKKCFVAVNLKIFDLYFFRL